ncbi:MAG: FkbM family methyltransferase [Gammaproteobacteria bacterium]|nr:FkbM family methyltransferase [Gammaproteobacteria bacterium]
MNISNKCTEILLWLYKTSNRMGWLDSQFIQSLYISSYFKYKKFIEDPYSRLVKHHSNLFKNGHILDIGANIGYTSFVFSKALGNTYNIFAFEPEYKNMKILKLVSQQYGFIKKLIPISAAVGDKEGEIELWRNESHNGDHRILTDELKKTLKGSIKTQKISVVSIDNYLKNYRNSSPVSFIKIDVQGYELAVCKGMQETLTNNPNAVIGFEYCPSIIKSLGFDPHELLEFFQKKNFNFYFLNKKNLLETFDVNKTDMLLPKKPHDYIDILCSQRDLLRVN